MHLNLTGLDDAFANFVGDVSQSFDAEFHVAIFRRLPSHFLYEVQKVRITPQHRRVALGMQYVVPAISAPMEIGKQIFHRRHDAGVLLARGENKSDSLDSLVFGKGEIRQIGESLGNVLANSLRSVQRVQACLKG